MKTLIQKRYAKFVTGISALFKQTILLLGQAFNSETYFQSKNVSDAFIEDKSKLKEILRDQSDSLNDLNYQSNSLNDLNNQSDSINDLNNQSDSMNDLNNQYLFDSHFEEKNKNVNAKQRPKPLFTGLNKGATGINFSNSRQNQHQQLFKGGSLQHHPRGRDRF